MSNNGDRYVQSGMGAKGKGIPFWFEATKTHYPVALSKRTCMEKRAPGVCVLVSNPERFSVTVVVYCYLIDVSVRAGSSENNRSVSLLTC